jgi:hypothetical protein
MLSMKLKKLVKQVLNEHPSTITKDGIRFIRRQNGDYMVALIDYDDQVKIIDDDKYAFVVCKCTAKDLKKALKELSAMAP